jgi:hypothetical protein
MTNLLSIVDFLIKEKNNALENDKLEKVPDDIMQGLKELGAFGMLFNILEIFNANLIPISLKRLTSAN